MQLLPRNGSCLILNHFFAALDASRLSKKTKSFFNFTDFTTNQRNKPISGYCSHLKHHRFSGVFMGYQLWTLARSSHRRCFIKKMFLKIPQNSQENTCVRVSFLTKLQAWGNFVKTKTLAQVFSCEFCEIFKNTFFTEHLRTTASDWPEIS